MQERVHTNRNTNRVEPVPYMVIPEAGSAEGLCIPTCFRIMMREIVGRRNWTISIIIVIVHAEGIPREVKLRNSPAYIPTDLVQFCEVGDLWWY